MPVYIPALVVPPPSSLRSSPGPGQSELGPSLSSPPPAERVWPGWGGAEGRHPGYIRENCETCERGYAGILLVRIPDRGYKALQVITNKENEDKNIFYRAAFKGCHKINHESEYCESVEGPGGAGDGPG